jgi:uncharacterized protein with FMN-binding domain
MEMTNKLPPAIAAIIVIALIALATVATGLLSDKTATPPDQTMTTRSPSSTNQEDSTSPSANTYKNGTYSAVGTYSTPGGRESIGLSVTIRDDKIVDSSLTQNARTEQAKDFQQRFASGYKQEVVGKKIEEVSLSRVAGSSLTSSGFNNALDTIKNDAGM